MSVQARKGFTVCRICQCEIPRPFLVINGLVFCHEHTREFRHRQREGVSTAELNPLWSDTLGNWRERPPELDKETKHRFLASPFTLYKRDESWLIFSRSYFRFTLPRPSRPSSTIRRQKKTFRLGGRRKKSSPPFYRFADHVAVNIQTGEVRRFVDVPENEVLDDLQGIHPAPAQAELAGFWGMRKPGGIREKTREHFRRQFLDEQERVRIPELVRLCHFPLYGPVGNPLDLTLSCSLSLSLSSIDSLSSVGFIYSRSSQTKVTIELEVSEVDTHARTFVDNDTPDQAVSSFDFARTFFRSKNQSGEEQETVENLSFWQGKLTIAGNLFTGELYHQSQPDQLSWFSLTSKQTRLTGNACGLSENELFQWLETLQIINQQDDVLRSYQREYDEDLQRVWSHSGRSQG